MQCVIYPGEDFCKALHEDGVDISGLYQGGQFRPPVPGKELPYTELPAAEIVHTPRDFVFAFDEFRRPMDPRRFAGEGGTPLEPGGKIIAFPTDGEEHAIEPPTPIPPEEIENPISKPELPKPPPKATELEPTSPPIPAPEPEKKPA